MPSRQPSTLTWNIVSFLLIIVLAFLPPIREIHKQLILLAIALIQLFEGRLLEWSPRFGASASVALKIALSAILLFHTGQVGINSSYYPIFYLPVITAAIFFGPVASLLWTALASAAYCSLLVPALREYSLTPDALSELALRVVFFFVAAVLVNRFAVDNRRQVRQYQQLSQALEETNRQLRRAEAEKRRSERLAALGQLSAGLAHEIRNPLGVIKGSAEMLSRKLAAAQPLAAELAGYISSEVNRLNALVARILDFARPLHLELRPTDVSQLLEHALQAVEAQFPENQVQVERRYDPVLPPVLLDAQLCERVFANLILNAFQAMDQRGTLRLSAEPSLSDPSAPTAVPGVYITVEDSGHGIPPDIREHIFNPFFTSKKDGVGLGLSIVSKILDDHQGFIRLETEPGRGARFRVFLPESPES